MFSSLLHLILSLIISYPFLIKFHDFADNSQVGMKHQTRGATQAQQGMTLEITLLSLLNLGFPTPCFKIDYVTNPLLHMRMFALL
jgi:hypothetical protein